MPKRKLFESMYVDEDCYLPAGWLPSFEAFCTGPSCSHSLANIYILSLDYLDPWDAFCTVETAAEEANTDTSFMELHKTVCEALSLNSTDALDIRSPDHLAYTDLYDELTTTKVHAKKWPEGITEDMYQQIEREAWKYVLPVQAH